MEDGVRINKYLSEIGYCSRREADRLIEEGAVEVNRKKPSPGTKIKYTDLVHVYGEKVSDNISEHVYLAFNKPVGIVSTTDTGEKDNIIDYIMYEHRVFPIGRLDKMSEGLIFLTSDGNIVNKILRSSNNHEKEYVVTVDRPVTDEFIQEMGSGIPIMGTRTKKCKVSKTSKFTFTIILTQGLNRQIRRMCEYLGYHVMKLKRTRIMSVKLDIPTGEWRELTKDEIGGIKSKLVDSVSTPKKSSNQKAKSHKKKKPTSNYRAPKKKTKHVNNIGKSKTKGGRRR